MECLGFDLGVPACYNAQGYLQSEFAIRSVTCDALINGQQEKMQTVVMPTIEESHQVR